MYLDKQDQVQKQLDFVPLHIESIICDLLMEPGTVSLPSSTVTQP